MQPALEKSRTMTAEEKEEKAARREAANRRRQLLVQQRAEDEKRAVVEKLLKQQKHAKPVNENDGRPVRSEDGCQPHVFLLRNVSLRRPCCRNDRL